MTIFDRCCDRTKRLMLVSGSALLASAIASSAAADTVRWRSVIGIIQAGNVVGNITGGGQPWSTLGGHASVDLSASRVEFEVRGLVLAGGNTIGTPGAVNQVKGTLVCDPGGLNVTIDTVLVPLSARGDAEFTGNVPPIPTTCTASNIVFLVRIAANRWIANGAVRSSPNDDH
jgi:opacity protein-like surface antigen